MAYSNTLKKPRVIIVGAGIGGLAAAGSLSPICDSIILIDKDSLTDSVEPRKSIVQANHLHSLLIAGQNILENIFPSITNEIVNAGGITLQAGIEQSIFEFGTWMPKRDLGLSIPAQSRLLLESVIRQRVKQLNNVTILDATRVIDISTENNKISGVYIQSLEDNQKHIKSDLVIDASGLSSTLTRKLNRLCPDIELKKEQVESNIVYVTATINKPEKWLKTKENILIVADPDKTCGGALLDIENDTWIVSLNGRNGVEPPTDIDGWKNFAHQLPASAIWERVKDSTIQYKLQKFKKPYSYLRRFDLVENLPKGYFPLGDTINSINPTFGQGMALALGHAEELGKALKDGYNDDTQKSYIKRATKRSEKAWRQTVAYESMFSKMDEKSRKKYQLLQSLVLNKHKQALNDENTHLELFKQAQMLT